MKPTFEQKTIGALRFEAQSKNCFIVDRCTPTKPMYLVYRKGEPFNTKIAQAGSLKKLQQIVEKV